MDRLGTLVGLAVGVSVGLALGLGEALADADAVPVGVADVWGVGVSVRVDVVVTAGVLVATSVAVDVGDAVRAVEATSGVAVRVTGVGAPWVACGLALGDGLGVLVRVGEGDGVGAVGVRLARGVAEDVITAVGVSEGVVVAVPCAQAGGATSVSSTARTTAKLGLSVVHPGTCAEDGRARLARSRLPHPTD